MQLLSMLIIILRVCGGAASCEALWVSNQSSSYDSSESLSEPGNAFSSLIFCAFGFIALRLPGHTTSYYTVMQLFVLTGIGSFAHHWLYSNADWAYQLDLIAMTALGGFSLHYMASGPTRFHRLLELLAISLCVLTLLLGRMGSHMYMYMWRVLVWFTGVTMAILQVHTCLQLVHTLVGPLRAKIFAATAWSGVLVALAVIAKDVDDKCPHWIRGTFNAHSLWHVLIAWSLFNAIQLSCLHDRLSCQENKAQCVWVPLVRGAPWLLFVITMRADEEPHMQDKSTTALLLPTHYAPSRPTRGHRRSATVTGQFSARMYALHVRRGSRELPSAKSSNNLLHESLRR